ncbi:MAG: helix-turn-helix domain-containing protein [Bacillota bacterium]
MYVSVATELVLFRHARRVPMRAYAKELGISQPALVDLERERNYPSRETLCAYARLVGVPADFLAEAQEQDRALAALTAPAAVAKRLLHTALEEIARVRQLLRTGEVSPSDLRPAALLALQHRTPKSVLALGSDPAVAPCWEYLAGYVLQRVNAPVTGSPGEEAAARGQQAPSLENPRDRADLVRLCLVRVSVDLRPGGLGGIREVQFEGITAEHGRV